MPDRWLVMREDVTCDQNPRHFLLRGLIYSAERLVGHPTQWGTVAGSQILPWWAVNSIACADDALVYSHQADECDGSGKMDLVQVQGGETK